VSCVGNAFSRRISRIGDSRDFSDADCLCAFDDFTSNFDYLGEWNSITHLNGKPGSAVAQNIDAIFTKFMVQGLTPRSLNEDDDENDMTSQTTPSWMHGHRKGFQGYQHPECMLSENENKRILLFHLGEILSIAQHYPNEIFHLAD